MEEENKIIEQENIEEIEENDGIEISGDVIAVIAGVAVSSSRSSFNVWRICRRNNRSIKWKKI